MRVGVVGCGYWGAKHVRVLSGLPRVSEVVVIESDHARRSAILDAFPGTIAASSLSEGLPLVDAVVVATPARTHAPLTRVVLRAGKHVLVEKPMAITAADASDLTRIAREMGVTLMVGHTFEHHEPVRALGEIIRSGQLGDLRYLTSTRLNLGLYQHDVNVVWDLAPHDVSILNFLLGGAPEAVNCWGWANMTEGLEDVAYLDLSYPGNVHAQVQVSWLHPTKVREITAVGTAAMAVYDDLAAGHPIRIHDKGAISGGPAKDVAYWDREVRMPVVGRGEALVAEDDHFLDCILSGATPTTDGRSGLAVTATLEAAERSLRERRVVSLAEVFEDADRTALDGLAAQEVA